MAKRLYAVCNPEICLEKKGRGQGASKSRIFVKVITGMTPFVNMFDTR